MMEEDTLLSVEGLVVDFQVPGQTVRAVDGVSYALRRGETLGIVGESGSGKSVSALAIMGLLPSCRKEGRVLFRGRGMERPVDMLALSEREARPYRGRHISMVFQDPMTSLNPLRRCGEQVTEMLRQHQPVGAKEARQRVTALFEEVRLPRPDKIFQSYPHEISGGQKQRVMIAMALVCEPDLLIADEPTTALDVTVQRAIIDLLAQLQQRRHIGILFISHDLGVTAQVASRVAVMYRGKMVEQGPVQEVLRHPAQPYTRALIACRPPLEGRPTRLPTVADFMSPDGGDVPSPAQTGASEPRAAGERKPLLSVRGLEVTYALKRNFFGKATQTLNGVDGMSFDILEGETLGLVGESGCGKTTLGRALLHLIQASAGSIAYRGQMLCDLSPAKMKRLRTKLQIIFQDPYSSLNPRMPIGDAILEPLRAHRLYGSHQERRQAVLDLMEQVGLRPEWYGRYPHEFSGGQRQRVCIARALVVRPELVVCDESVSALDVSVQAQVLNLLNDLKRRHGYTYLFISHDLGVVRYFSDRIIVMRGGRLQEMGEADEVFRHPREEYTRSLVSALPRI